MAYPIPPDDQERIARIERDAAALGITVIELLAERALRRPYEVERSPDTLIRNRESYLEGYRNSEIDDTLDNIHRIELELRWLERVVSSTELQVLWKSDPDACFAALRKD